MAKKIKWTETSIRDRLSIYYFWIEKNKTDSYSEKLEKLFNEAAKLISEYPEIGTKTNASGIKVKVVKGFKLFYLNLPDSIQIIRVWDTRQNPRKLKF